MRKLNRSLVPPQCLSNYNYTADKWKDNVPDSACKDAIWQSLQIMQGGFCVYCESIAVKGNGHIEHFFHKGVKKGSLISYQHLTFEWINLFGSCGYRTGDSCGHYKDREGSGPGTYDSNHIIKPDVDDPKYFFNFLATGVIEPRAGLSPLDTQRALETLRVLNLGLLNGSRKRQIDRFKNELNELEIISHTISEDTLRMEIEKIMERIRQEEFQTAVLESLFN